MPPRRRASTSIDALVSDALADVVRRASGEIALAVARLTAQELTAQLEAGIVGASAGSARPAAARGARPALARWVADRRARRVPTFVIELTGLHTKKQIVAKYGDGAAFEKGKPLPRPKGA
jgi:hypothetical protein